MTWLLNAQSALSVPVTSLKGIGPKRKILLHRLGINSIGDLLLHLPRAYESLRDARNIADVSLGEKIAVTGTIREVRLRRLLRRRTLVEAVLEDGTGHLNLVWFNQPYMSDQIHEGQRVRAFGKVGLRGGLFIASPQLLDLEDSSSDRIVPLYPATEGLGQRFFRKAVSQALEQFSDSLEDPLPSSLTKRFSLMSLQGAVCNIHSPSSDQALAAAKKRLAFQEALVFQLGIARHRLAVRSSRKMHRFSVTGKINTRIAARIPFTLTPGQRRAVAEIQRDMASPRPMNRLLQGDVGSGKTVVALWAMLTAVANRSQAAMMVPTELLALQHYERISNLLKGSRVRIVSCVGSLPPIEKTRAREQIAAGEADIVVGTHALLRRETTFRRLGLAVVDEQHRFGVLQRATLAAKATLPDVLVMTATPIPRTLSLTLFSDLELSTIDDLPPGRVSVATSIVEGRMLNHPLEFIAELIRRGGRGFYICPAISSGGRRASVKRLSAELQRGPLKGVLMAPLHGKLSWEERAGVLKKFRQGALHLLLSTTVAEVGIDVPEATFIVIDDARCFGLAQLHQLRGRVGRGGRPSYCFLIDRGGEPAGRRRLEILARTQDGFEIAEADLRLRGPGEVFGVRQSGALRFKMVNLLSDMQLMATASKEASRLLSSDPCLARPEHGSLALMAEEKFGSRSPLVGVG